MARIIKCRVEKGVVLSVKKTRAKAMAQNEASLHLGIDFGTSGARATLINSVFLSSDTNGLTSMPGFLDKMKPLHELKIQYKKTPAAEWDAAWSKALDELLTAIPTEMSPAIVSLAFDGTSSTTLLIDEATGRSLEQPQWYNAAQSQAAVDYAKKIAPEGHPGRASTSTLCKVIQWHLDKRWQDHQAKGYTPRVMHQADWLSFLMHGNAKQSDYTNALKLGYDPGEENYPHWLQEQAFFSLLPTEIVAPGVGIAPVLESVQRKYRLGKECLVCAGTTDSIAAFLAAGATEVGEAVTSLGSTLAIKMLSKERVDAVDYGVYSHRLGDKWLVGGASNTGGAVLKNYFTDQELELLTERIDIDIPSQLGYYPLVSKGERFPINDPDHPPRLEPRPVDDAVFLQGMLEGIASIEGQCYHLLEALGAGRVQKVWTAGGGAINQKWTAIRQRVLGVPVQSAPNGSFPPYSLPGPSRSYPLGEASYGAALLAKRGYDLAQGS